MKTGWTNNTPTHVVLETYRTKSAILQMWEAEPIEVQERESEYIADLVRRVRQIRVYLTHRRDCPVL